MFRKFGWRLIRIGAAVAACTLLVDGGLKSHANTIAATGFETSGDTWLGVSISGSVSSASTTTGTGDFPALQRILDGTHSFQTNNGTNTADFDPVNVSAFSSVQLTIRISSTASTANNGNDAGDNVKLFVALNGASFSLTPDITLSGLANARWGYDATLVGTTTAGTPVSLAAPQGTVMGDPPSNTNNYSTLVINIPSTATLVDFRIVATNDNSGEFWNIDHVTLTGTPISIPEPSAAVALVGGLGMLCGFRRLRRS